MGFLEEIRAHGAGPSSPERVYTFPVPYIVMPLADKDVILAERDDSNLVAMLEHPMKHVWKLAARVLSEAGEVIIAGYGLREADVKAVKLLHESLPPDLPPERIIIVSDTEEGANGVEDRLGRPGTKCTRGFANYCRKRFELR